MERVRPKTFVLKLLPYADSTATALAGRVWLPDKMYARYQSGELNLFEQSIIIHEETHLKRQAERGLILWLWQYLRDPDFRYNEELEAVKTQCEFIQNHGFRPPIEHYAKHLSSTLYQNMVEYEKALNDLSQII